MISASLAAVLTLAATAARAALPVPPFNGVVVEDVTQTYVFDRVGILRAHESLGAAIGLDLGVLRGSPLGRIQ
jgi:hypothetical protein